MFGGEKDQPRPFWSFCSSVRSGLGSRAAGWEPEGWESIPRPLGSFWMWSFPPPYQGTRLGCHPSLLAEKKVLRLCCPYTVSRSAGRPWGCWVVRGVAWVQGYLCPKTRECCFLTPHHSSGQFSLLAHCDSTSCWGWSGEERDLLWLRPGSCGASEAKVTWVWVCIQGQC